MLILGSNIPENKAAMIAVKEIFGAGTASAIAICNLAGINPKTPIKDFNSTQLDLFVKSCRRLISKDGARNQLEAIKFLVSINNYRGSRHVLALPCRGQRTRTNASTSKALLSKFRGKLLNKK